MQTRKFRAAVLWLLFFPLFFAGCTTRQAATSDIKTVDVHTFEKLMANPDVVLLDVRTPEEFSDGHLKEAMNIDILNEGFGERIKQLDKDKTYLLYCRSGGRSAKAMDQMEQQGFLRIYNLDGGITGWQEQHKPVVK